MYIKRIFALILMLNFIMLFSCSNLKEITDNNEITSEDIAVNDIALQREESQDLNVIYDNENNLKMDIYYPTNIKYDKSPLIIAFHGGGWIAGDKSQIMYIFAPIIADLRENGYTVATVQYRYASQSVFPAQIIDCIHAIQYLKNNADDYNIDAESVGVMGYSAGAQLAMLAAYVPDEFNDFYLQSYSININYCLSFAGPTKMYGDELSEFSDSVKYLLENLFDGAYEEKEIAYMRGSPYIYMENVETFGRKIPLLLVHDEKDDVVPFTQSEVMYNKAVELEVPCELLRLNGFYHQIDFNYYPDGEDVKIILDFIYKYS